MKYTVHSKKSQVTFYSTQYNGIRVFNNMTTTYSFEDHITVQDVSIICNIKELIFSRDTSNIYMITLYDGIRHLYINSSLKDIEYIIQPYIEMYNNYIVIDQVIVRETLPNLHPPTHRYASRGEGIDVYMGDGFWSLDVSRSTKYCLINAAICWQYYSNYIEIPNSDILRNLRKEYCRNNNIPSHISTAYLGDVVKIYHENITPDDTMQYMVLYIDCNHGTLVIHEKYLSNKYIKWLRYRSKCTFVQPIRQICFNYDNNNTLITADIECYRDKSELPIIHHIPLVICCYDGTSVRQFVGNDCVYHMLQYFMTLNNPTIWMHNAGGYDSHIILKSAFRLCNKLLYNPIEICDVDGSIVKLVIHTMYNDIVIQDSYRLLPSSLNKLANDLLGKHKDNFDIVNATRDGVLSDTCLKYNVADCQLLHEILIKSDEIVTSNGWPSCIVSFTLSSYAKKIFYSTYYDYNRFPIYVMPRWIHDYIHRGYKGGRCEVFKKGVIKGPLYMYDINSMYPYSGCNDLPYGKPIFTDGINIRITKDFVLRNFGFYDLTIISSNILSRPLHGISTNSGYIFGKFTKARCILFSQEVLMGLELGYEYLIHSMVTYNKSPHMRKMFIDIFNLKMESNDNSERSMWKLISNSCYGFMGFRKYNRTVLNTYGIQCGDEVIASHLSGSLEFSQINDIFLVSENTHVLLNDTNISIASAISSYSRIYLHKLITDIEHKGINVLYCDTDSVIVDGFITDNIGKNMGQFKREYEDLVIQEACIINSKMYGFKTSNGYVVKIKGIKTNVSYTEDGTMKHDDISESLYKSMAEGLSPTIITSRIRKDRQSKLNNVFIYEVIGTCSISIEYNKGIVCDDGVVVPFTYVF